MYIMSCVRFATEVKAKLKMKLGGQATKFAGKKQCGKSGDKCQQSGP
jgi:hypothetical protein